MSERVYSIDKSEHQELKRLLTYDPYFDPDLIPPYPKDLQEKPNDKLTDEERKILEDREKIVNENMKKIKEMVILSRQETDLREGASFGLDSEKSYIYISGTDEFFIAAEKFLKSKFKSIARATPEEEKKVIEIINEEKSKANAGFGMMFG